MYMCQHYAKVCILCTSIMYALHYLNLDPCSVVVVLSVVTVFVAR